MEDTAAINEIGDYAVAKGLHYAVYYDPYRHDENAVFLGNATERWGDMFAGVYYGDEYGGKMLEEQKDFSPYFYQDPTSGILLKAGGRSLQTSDGSFYPNGTIIVNKWDGGYPDETIFKGVDESGDTPVYIAYSTQTTITYHPDGVTVIEETKTRESYYSFLNVERDR